MNLLTGKAVVPASPIGESPRIRTSMKPNEVSRCLVCGGESFVPVFPTRLPWLVRCPECGLRLVWPQPTDAELADIYGPDYFTPFGSDLRFADGYRQMKAAGASRLLRIAERHIVPGKLLDLGSGLGELLLTAMRRGWEVQGIEPNPDAVKIVNERLPESVFLGTLDTFRPRDAAYDLITCVEVIEHLRFPDWSLRRMFDLLRPGGALVLTTPNVGCWQGYLLGPRWPHYHRDHLWYFDRATLTTMVRTAGFEVMVCRRAWKTFNLRYILGILAQTRNFSAGRRLAQIALRRLPGPVLKTLLPPIAEGCLLVARRPITHQGQRVRRRVAKSVV